MKTKNIILYVLLLITLIFGIWFWRGTLRGWDTFNSKQEIAPPLATDIKNTPSVAEVDTKPLLGDKYNLFVRNKNNSFTPTIKMIEDGVISGGKYSGYNRFFVFYPNEIDTPYFVFATKDYKNFILGTALDTLAGPIATSLYNDANFNIFNKIHVTTLDNFPINHPAQITVGNFTLLRQSAITESLANKIELPSNQPGLRYFYLNSNYHGDSNSVFQNYIQGQSTIYVQDSSGFTFMYSLSDSYKNTDFVKDPGYKSYAAFLAGGCGDLGTTYVLKNISLSDLVKFTSTKDGKINFYTPKDPNSQLNKAEYSAKVTDETYFSEHNGNISPPSFADYVAKNPVLIFQDPWSRFVAIGETQYLLEGGCGKPVIYLYPTVPTEVSINFINPINLSTDIPKYANGWNVLANPDGTLKDLQRDATNCDKINYSKEGSEYARNACAEGIYPYLYWSGQASGIYPRATDGWIVDSADLDGFLNSKLSEIGLNQKEKTDMLDFWVPEMQKKNAPFYRISFFQTQQMNDFIPMNVKPKPHTTIRVFLDWAPLTSKPTTELLPQVLQKIDREGFTLVEWGGLKQ